MSTKRLGFKFNRNDELLSEVQENDVTDPHVQPRSTDASTLSGQQGLQDASCVDLNSTTSSNGSESGTSQTRNLKNLSIKEFFATKLMRTRSFEGGNQSPSRDEATNWFEEFKARMSKKPSNHSRGHPKYPNTEEMIEKDDPFIDLGESIGTSTTNLSHDKPSFLNHYSFKGNNEEDVTDQQDESSTLTRENCLKNLMHDDKYIDPAKESKFLFSNNKLRKRKLRQPRISSMEADLPDFDTASINTIFNRRDSRYNRQSIHKANEKKSQNRIILSMRSILEASFAFDSSLPWKLLSLFCLGVVFIISILYSQSASAISFVNGLLIGIVLTLLCIGIIFLCLILKMFPFRQKTACSSTDASSLTSYSTKLNRSSSLKSKTREDASQPVNTSASMDSSTVKDETSIAGISQQYNSLYEDDAEELKGWMIEYMGDYELRKTGDVKLQLIFVRLDGPILRLCKPKNTDPSSLTIFTQQRIYDLASSGKVNICLLLPKSIRNREKWIWSKKYPIRLEFYSQESIHSIPKLLRFTLFVKSCRAKEEWFQRLRAVVDRYKVSQDLLPPISSSPTSSSLHSCQDPEDVFSDCNPTPTRCNTPLALSKSEIMSPAAFKRSTLHPFTSDQLSSNDGASISDQLSGCFSGLVRTKSCEEIISMKVLTNNDKKLDKINDEHSDALPDPSVHKKPRHSADEASIRSSAEALNTEQSSDIGNKNSKSNNKPNLVYKEFVERIIESGLDASPNSKWFNSLVGRMFFDVFSHAYWSVWFKRKIQRKLYRIRLPYFMETLTLTKIDLGSNPPQFRRVVSHNFDSFGLNIDFDMAYSGGLELTFETKLNLLKIKDTSNSSSSNNNNEKQQQQQQQQSISSELSETSSVLTPGSNGSIASNSMRASDADSSDTEESDSNRSSDSSCDEGDVDEISDWEEYGAEKTRQSFVRFVDKIASSKYFQHATENKFIKKKLQDISNCPLVLVVQIQSLNGTLSLNVPPPPTDRLWYGFKPDPDLVLKALPKMGDREVSLTQVTEWIEKKLVDEFKKILVIPNMEDIVLPVLKTDSDRYVTVVP